MIIFISTPFKFILRPIRFGPKSSKPNHAQYIRKKTFLLFEILIALLLVSICLTALIERPIQGYISEWKLCKEIEGERLANLAFCEIKEKLLKNEIPWDKIPSPGQMSAPFLLPPIILNLPSHKPITIERSFILRCKKKGEKTNANECYRLLNVEVFFNPKLSQKRISKNKGHYSYRVLVYRSQLR